LAAHERVAIGRREAVPYRRADAAVLDQHDRAEHRGRLLLDEPHHGREQLGQRIAASDPVQESQT
jgi:hypothetical protein